MRLAFWLMDRFGVPEPLVGDLLEERSRHRSALWQWRQTLVAILWTVARDIRAHRWLAARAVVTGWAVGQLAAPIRRIAMPLMSGAWVSNSEQWLVNSLGHRAFAIPDCHERDCGHHRMGRRSFASGLRDVDGVRHIGVPDELSTLNRYAPTHCTSRAFTSAVCPRCDRRRCESL